MLYYVDENKKLHRIAAINVTDESGYPKSLSAFIHTLGTVWRAVHSCFGAGYWINDYPWSNTDLWKNQ